ncbi:hypothetical protein LCGC14_0615190 [marine sediment metagenome]|uniref:Uncharacterized protein n=1 Tax=marine sediment metagenome TaxID=412755 RepID=A0A0F9RB99_9ZZZZ|nr:hypothetical protein [bacterium]
MKQLDLTGIPVNQIYLGWLSRIVAQVKPKEILITKEQSDIVLSSIGGSWEQYRGIPLKVI